MYLLLIFDTLAVLPHAAPIRPTHVLLVVWFVPDCSQKTTSSRAEVRCRHSTIPFQRHWLCGLHFLLTSKFCILARLPFLRIICPWFQFPSAIGCVILLLFELRSSTF